MIMIAGNQMVIPSNQARAILNRALCTFVFGSCKYVERGCTVAINLQKIHTLKGE